MIVTVGIKALNEEQRIASSIASALKAVQPFQGEVIVADSGSIDRTVAIAKDFPVRIYQLANVSERSCGAGAQLAFQHALGDYFYILDGDMVLNPDFIPAAIAYLEANPDVAGVGGRVREMNTDSEEYRIRAQTGASGKNWRPGPVDQLDCGGLYRSEAIRQSGYFADRNLHAFEEFELATRLREAGWKLARIDMPSVGHFGHTIAGPRLLLRWLQTGYAWAPAEVLKSAIGTPRLSPVLHELRHIRYSVLVIVWWCLLLYALGASKILFLSLLVAPIAALSARRRSLSLGLYSFAMWNVYAMGFLIGLTRSRRPPEREVRSMQIK